MTKFVKIQEVDHDSITPKLLFIGMTNLLERMNRLEEVVADMASVVGMELTGHTINEEVMDKLIESLSAFVETVQKEREVQHEAAVEFSFLNSPE